MFNYSSYLQAGGGLPFVSYTPFQGVQQSTPQQYATSKKGSDEEDNIKLKDLLKLVDNLDGLPSDTSKLIADIRQMYSEASLFNNGEIDTDSLVSTYLSTLQKIKHAGYNKKEYENAYSEVVKNGGLNDVAINDRGQLVCATEKDGVKYVSISDYMKDPSSYQTLTNQDLLTYRANDIAFNNKFLEIASNGIGYKKVSEYIEEALKGLGTSSLQYDGYSSREGDKITRGMDLLNEYMVPGMTVEGLYKVKSFTQDQKEQINSTLKYLWKALPNNAKSWLALKGGNQEKPEEGAFDLMADLAFARRSYKYDYSVDLQTSLNPDGSAKTKAQKGEQDDYKSNPYVQMQKQQGGTQGRLSIMPWDSSSGLSVDGTFYSSIQGQDGKVVGDTSVDALLNSGLQGIIKDRGAITFGDQIVGEGQLKDILYTNTGGTVTTLPTKNVGGKQVVALEVIDDWAKIQPEINQLQTQLASNTITKEAYDAKFAELLKEANLDAYIDSSGRPNYNNFGQFLAIDAYTTDRALKKNKDANLDSRFIEKVRNPDSDLEQRMIRGLSTNKDKDNYEVDIKDWWQPFELGYDDIYQGVVYIPMIQNENAGINAWGDQVKSSQSYGLEYEYQTWNKRRQGAGTTSASVLNDEE